MTTATPVTDADREELAGGFLVTIDLVDSLVFSASSLTRTRAENSHLLWLSAGRRVTRIMNLLHLKPGLQEELLFLPLIERSRDTLLERHLRPIAAVPDLRKQRRMWKELRRQYDAADNTIEQTFG